MPHQRRVRVGEDIFAPGWTDYHKRVRYGIYDVTELLRKKARTCSERF